MAHVGDVEVCGVFDRWSPRTDDGLDGGAVVVANVATEQDKGGTEAVLHGDELLKLGVIRVVDFAQPDIADANVERVVVSDASRERLLGTWGDWHEGGWLGLQQCCSIGDKLNIGGCVVWVGHVLEVFSTEGGDRGDEQVPEAGVVGACMGLATSEGGLFLVDTINVVMTEGVAGIACEV